MVKVKQLSNGIQVLLEQMEGMRSAAIGIFVKVGSAYETKENNGISHVIEHMLFKGTAKRTAKDLADQMAKIGGDLNAYTAKEETCYYAKVLDEHLPEAVVIMGDMICHSRMDKTDLQKELSIIMEEIDMYLDSPEDLVEEMVLKNSFPEHPIGFLISGEKKRVKEFTDKQVKEFFDYHYTADRMVISIAGSFKEEEIIGLLEQEFASIKPTGEGICLKTPLFQRSFSYYEKDNEQSHICLAYEGVGYENKAKYCQSILNNILGGSMNSRLFQTIREDMGLVYSIESYIGAWRDTGVFYIYAGANPHYLPKVLEETAKCMEEIRDYGVTIEELESAKEQIRVELLMSRESTNSRMNSNGKNMLCRNRIISVEETIKSIEQVGLEELNQFIGGYLKKQRCSLCVVGPKNSGQEMEMRKLWGGIF